MMQYNFDATKGSIYVKCMEGAKTNMCYNVVDRHVGERNLGDKVAFYWYAPIFEIFICVDSPYCCFYVKLCLMYLLCQRNK